MRNGLSPRQAHVLGRATDGRVIPDEELRGTKLFAVACDLSAIGALDHGYWADGGGRGWKLSQYGLGLLRVLEGRNCEWCCHQAVDARQTRRAGCFIYFCRGHREIAEASAKSPTSERGSLYGLIRTGRLKHREPDEVAA